MVKLKGGRIESRFGAQLIAEGTAGQRVVFTSCRTTASVPEGRSTRTTTIVVRRGENQPVRGDWGGLLLWAAQLGSIDHALIAFGGGINRIEGTFAGFNVIEMHQANCGSTNSVIENNSLGIGGQGPLDRLGRGYNVPATIFVRGRSRSSSTTSSATTTCGVMPPWPRPLSNAGHHDQCQFVRP